jgi:uncharacterized membrane protein YfcA
VFAWSTQRTNPVRVLLVVPGLVLLFAGVYCVVGKDMLAGANPLDVVPPWIGALVGALGCIAGLGVIVFGAGRRKF